MAGDLLDHYRTIEAVSRDMLRAARAGNWDDVALQERQCKHLIGTLEEALRSNQLDADQKREKMRIMLRLVQIDAEVRRLAQPWLRSLDLLLGARPTSLGPSDQHG